MSQRLVAFINSENHEDLIVLDGLIEAGKLMPALDRTFPLSEAGEAIRYLGEGHAHGKVAIKVEVIPAS